MLSLYKILYLLTTSAMVLVAVAITAAVMKTLKVLADCQQLGFVSSTGYRVVRGKTLIEFVDGKFVDKEKDRRDASFAGALENLATSVGNLIWNRMAGAGIGIATVGLIAAHEFFPGECEALLKVLNVLTPIVLEGSTKLPFTICAMPTKPHISRKVARMWMRQVKKVSETAERFDWKKRREERPRCARTTNRGQFLKRRWKALRQKALRELQVLLRGPVSLDTTTGTAAGRKRCSGKYRARNIGQPFVPTPGLRAKVASYIPSKPSQRTEADVEEAILSARAFFGETVEEQMREKHELDTSWTNVERSRNRGRKRARGGDGCKARDHGGHKEVAVVHEVEAVRKADVVAVIDQQQIHGAPAVGVDELASSSRVEDFPAALDVAAVAEQPILFYDVGLELENEGGKDAPVAKFVKVATVDTLQEGDAPTATADELEVRAEKFDLLLLFVTATGVLLLCTTAMSVLLLLATAITIVKSSLGRVDKQDEEQGTLNANVGPADEHERIQDVCVADAEKKEMERSSATDIVVVADDCGDVAVDPNPNPKVTEHDHHEASVLDTLDSLISDDGAVSAAAKVPGKVQELKHKGTTSVGDMILAVLDGFDKYSPEFDEEVFGNDMKLLKDIGIEDPTVVLREAAQDRKLPADIETGAVDFQAAAEAPAVAVMEAVMENFDELIDEKEVAIDRAEQKEPIAENSKESDDLDLNTVQNLLITTNKTHHIISSPAGPINNVDNPEDSACLAVLGGVETAAPQIQQLVVNMGPVDAENEVSDRKGDGEKSADSKVLDSLAACSSMASAGDALSSEKASAGDTSGSDIKVEISVASDLPLDVPSVEKSAEGCAVNAANAETATVIDSNDIKAVEIVTLSSATTNAPSTQQSGLPSMLAPTRMRIKLTFKALDESKAASADDESSASTSESEDDKMSSSVSTSDSDEEEASSVGSTSESEEEQPVVRILAKPAPRRRVGPSGSHAVVSTATPMMSASSLTSISITYPLSLVTSTSVAALETPLVSIIGANTVPAQPQARTNGETAKLLSDVKNTVTDLAATSGNMHKRGATNEVFPQSEQVLAVGEKQIPDAPFCKSSVKAKETSGWIAHASESTVPASRSTLGASTQLTSFGGFGSLLEIPPLGSLPTISANVNDIAPAAEAPSPILSSTFSSSEIFTITTNQNVNEPALQKIVRDIRNEPSRLPKPPTKGCWPAYNDASAGRIQSRIPMKVQGHAQAPPSLLTEPVPEALLHFCGTLIPGAPSLLPEEPFREAPPTLTTEPAPDALPSLPAELVLGELPRLVETHITPPRVVRMKSSIKKKTAPKSAPNPKPRWR
ncbi:hypothetical protein HDU97_008198 [Phlyctochytrium planicorne]|nr:hypothetical protein HDU97_008198 [Phlyctochytrium planicorne]